MRGKWIDNRDYFGSDRRRMLSRRLWKERRRFDEAGEPPALTSMLRRLRVQLLDLRTPEDRKHALQLAGAAIAQAQAQGNFACAGIVHEVSRMIVTGEHEQADARLIEALRLVS